MSSEFIDYLSATSQAAVAGCQAQARQSPEAALKYLVLGGTATATLLMGIAMLYGWSLTYCMTTSLGRGGVGLGTCGLPDSAIRGLARDAGFSAVQQVPFESPFNVLYELRR